MRTLLNLEADPAELDQIRLIRPEKSNNVVVNLQPTSVAKYECNGLPRLPRLVEVGGAGTARRFPSDAQAPSIYRSALPAPRAACATSAGRAGGSSLFFGNN